MNAESLVEAAARSIESLDMGYVIDRRSFSDGDLGDLLELDFSDGSRMGHIAVWSSGNAFYNLIDIRRDTDFEIIPESHIDLSTITCEDFISILKHLFEEMKVPK